MIFHLLVDHIYFEHHLNKLAVVVVAAYIDFVAYIVEDFAYIDLVVILKEQQALEVVQKALVEALPLIEDLVVIAVVVVVEVVEVKKVLLALEEEQKALVVVNSLMEQVEVNH